MHEIWETKISPYVEGEEATIRNVMTDKDTLSEDELKAIGLKVEIIKTLPERPHPFYPDDKSLRLAPMHIYSVTIPQGFIYKTVENRYWRELYNDRGQLIAAVFAKHGQYIEFRKR